MRVCRAAKADQVHCILMIVAMGWHCKWMVSFQSCALAAIWLLFVCLLALGKGWGGGACRCCDGPHACRRRSASQGCQGNLRCSAGKPQPLRALLVCNHCGDVLAPPRRSCTAAQGHRGHPASETVIKGVTPAFAQLMHPSNRASCLLVHRAVDGGDGDGDHTGMIQAPYMPK
jgi:hypothetical protein